MEMVIRTAAAHLAMRAQKKGRRSRGVRRPFNRWEHSFPKGRRGRFRRHPSPGAHGINALGQAGRRYNLSISDGCSISLRHVVPPGAGGISGSRPYQAANQACILSACSVQPIPGAVGTAPPRGWCRPHSCPGSHGRNCS